MILDFVKWFIHSEVVGIALLLCLAIYYRHVVLGLLALPFAIIVWPIVAIHRSLRSLFAFLASFGFDKSGRIELFLQDTAFYEKHPRRIAEEILAYEAARFEEGLPPYSTYAWCCKHEDTRYVDLYKSLVRRNMMDPSREKQVDGRNSGSEAHSSKAFEGREQAQSVVFDPWNTLGLARNASSPDIKKAYRKKMLMNHPDRVADLDPLLRQFAEKRAIEIHKAYKMLAQDSP